MQKEIKIIASFLVVDQIIKLLAMNLNETIVLIPNVIQLNYVQNFGVAWSMFSNKLIYIIIFSIIAIWYLFKILFEYKMYPIIHFGILMMIGGALGNLVDRVFRGFVVDYIQLQFINFPIFNFADMLLVCGVGIVFIDYIRKVKNGETF